MTPRPVDPARDPAEPALATTVTIEFEGRRYEGVRGQTVAGILLSHDVLDWRTTSVSGAGRGLFCGIGVCFDCVVSVDGVRDVRACQRRARGGELVERQHDRLPQPREER
ncbi:(2Fe-2S)-binding protein [Mumia sp. zg.B17]|uniref:(2Fe-2S)-binding protein n=1 Tax=Mumia sp. zg.B17 TaxID=2855446 RepID=UPI0027E398CF|nr:(2Fe-2S)-binding protein [Mumia sp. zg.B17]